MCSSLFRLCVLFVTLGNMTTALRMALPKLPLPPMLLSNEPGTWAYDTMSRRVRTEILGREVLEANAALLETMPDAKAKLLELDAELAAGASTPLRHIQGSGPDLETWKDIMAEYVDGSKTWLEAPWLVTEFYLYRRIMEALDYFNTGIDPFADSKRKGLESAFASMEALAPKVLATVEMNFVANATGGFQGSLTPKGENQFPADQLEANLRLFTLISLWGNRMDLSLWPAGSEGNVADAFSEVLAAGEANLLADDFPSLLSVCAEAKANGGRRFDIVVDNAGFELVTDLCLADFLVSSGVASEVVFQLKGHPTFVSDALAKDLRQHVFALRGLDKTKFPGCTALGERWQNMLADRRWRMREDMFWVQPLAFWELPPHLRDDIGAGSALVFTKGDANYRRLLGDRSWALDAPFTDVCGYFPTTLCALRTLKAELGCGMSNEQVERAAAADEKWQVNGKFGVIQVAPPAAPE